MEWMSSRSKAISVVVRIDNAIEQERSSYQAFSLTPALSRW